MNKIILNNCNIYDRSRNYYKAEVYEFWNKLENDIRLFQNQKFFFDNPWDMERCSTAYKINKNIFNRTPNKDPEWVFQMSRFEWISKFILLYYKTNDSKLIDEWKKLVITFFNNNNHNKNGLINTQNNITLIDRVKRKIKSYFFKPTYPTYRTLDTAIRNYSLLINIIYCHKLNRDISNKQILSRILIDSQYTYNNLRKFDETSNWGIIIICSYLICNLIINTKHEDYSIIIEKLNIMLNKQILPNGAHIESSHMYHNQVLLFLLRLIFWAKKCQFTLPNNILDKTCKMAKYSRDFITPNGTQDLFGDSDNTSLSTLLAISDVILGYEKELPLIDKPDFILLHEFDFNFSLKKSPNATTESYTKDGITRLSCGDYVVFIYNTQYYSNHKHSDNGSFTLYYKNQPIIIDSGRYTYHKPYWREYFKSCSSHSTIYIDGFNIKSDVYSKNITNIVNEITISEEDVQAYISYNVHKKWRLSRRFILTSKGLEIHDEYFDVPCNIVHQNIILHPDIKPISNSNLFINYKYKLEYETDYEVSKIAKTWISHHYNEKVKSYKIHMNGYLKNNRKKITKIKIHEQ